MNTTFYQIGLVVLSLVEKIQMGEISIMEKNNRSKFAWFVVTASAAGILIGCVLGLLFQDSAFWITVGLGCGVPSGILLGQYYGY